MKTIRVKITGTVQGVLFRKFIKEQALGLDLRGHVRNLDDGQVEVIIEGNDTRVNQMIKICKQGPKHSVVKGVFLQELNFIGFDDFKILSV